MPLYISPESITSTLVTWFQFRYILSLVIHAWRMLVIGQSVVLDCVECVHGRRVDVLRAFSCSVLYSAHGALTQGLPALRAHSRAFCLLRAGTAKEVEARDCRTHWSDRVGSNSYYHKIITTNILNRRYFKSRQGLGCSSLWKWTPVGKKGGHVTFFKLPPIHRRANERSEIEVVELDMGLLIPKQSQCSSGKTSKVGKLKVLTLTTRPVRIIRPAYPAMTGAFSIHLPHAIAATSAWGQRTRRG